MEEEDDLLTPYKEESYEIYEKRMTEESDMWETASSSTEQDEKSTPTVTNRPPSVENDTIRKRGRPRKRLSEDQLRQENSSPADEIAPTEEPIVETIPEKDTADKPETTDSIEKIVDDCLADITALLAAHLDSSSEDKDEKPVQKRRLGRPKKGEMTENSQKRILQSLRCIIPDGVKRKARPSCMLDDFESFRPKDSPHEEEESYQAAVNKEFLERVFKPKRGRPRIYPPKIRILNPDGTPRGRGRPKGYRPKKEKIEKRKRRFRRTVPKPENSDPPPQMVDPKQYSPFTLRGTERKRFPKLGKRLGRPPQTGENKRKIAECLKTEEPIENACGISERDQSSDGPSEAKKPKIEVKNEIYENTPLTKAGTVRIRFAKPGKKLGRPRVREEKKSKISTGPRQKRVARPGKKLGRPRKGEEKNSKLSHPIGKKTKQKTWNIKLNGLFKNSSQFIAAKQNLSSEEDETSDTEHTLKLESKEDEKQHSSGSSSSSSSSSEEDSESSNAEETDSSSDSEDESSDDEDTDVKQNAVIPEKSSLHVPEKEKPVAKEKKRTSDQTNGVLAKKAVNTDDNVLQNVTKSPVLKKSDQTHSTPLQGRVKSKTPVLTNGQAKKTAETSVNQMLPSNKTNNRKEKPHLEIHRNADSLDRTEVENCPVARLDI